MMKRKILPPPIEKHVTMANDGSTSSSLTSTSHTMTAFPTPDHRSSASSKLTTDTSPARTLLEALTPQSRHSFIAPPLSIPDASLGYVKEILDSFAGKLGDEQAERLKEQRKKRKRGDAGQVHGEVLKIRKVHVDGFEVEQVWEQARRVIDALKGDAERVLEEFGSQDEGVAEEEESVDGGVDLMKFDEDGFEIGSDDDGEEDEEVDIAENDMDFSDEVSQPDETELQDGNSDEESSIDINGEDEEVDEEGEGEETNEVYVPDPNGLNDGFFSIDSFNKQTEFLEQQDASANPFSREESDDEEIDWEADPMAGGSQPVPSSRRAAAMDIEDEDGESEGDDEDGPTFGNMDLNAPEGDSEEDDEDADMEELDHRGDNANDVFYKDFFEPPPRKAGKGERQSNYLERQSRKPKAAEPENVETEIERAIADVRRDLFDDDTDQENSEDALSEVDPADPKSRKSAHERRQAKIAEEIRRLEAASVAKREWALSGEARAADRPLNSLLEEDLDFERTGKPVLEVTAEVSESIEELIKRRILAQEFDEVIRRRPDDLGASSTTRRGAFELDDSKPQQSLAEIYEEEHVKATNPDAYVSKADEKVHKEEKEIELLWKEVSAKLDALSSWHYKPKPVAPSLTVVSDVATVAMEDAQPTTASGISGGESMLAPQEIYKAGKEKKDVEKSEVVPKSGAPIARQEMTREEKLRRRRREKERIKKRGGVEANQRPESKNRKQKRETLGDLKKGGVKVIGKKGDIRDVEGNKIQASTATNSGGSFKL